MALLIFPIGLALGWFIAQPLRAAAVTGAVGVLALVMLVILGIRGSEVSPLESLVLIIGTPIAAALASAVARRRPTRRPTMKPPTHDAAASLRHLR